MDSPNGSVDYSDHLSPEHRHVLSASAISPEVAADRGYRTLTDKAELIALGFADYQARPGLVVPIYNVVGTLATYQLRPDVPRIVKDKPNKYETPKDTRMVLDVPRRVRSQLDDPHVPLIITEGAKKADAGVSAGLCVIALLGVWNFRGTNAKGGKTALADFEAIALNGRDVYICFDSDVMLNPKVYKALCRLAALLEARGAIVRYIYLPGGTGNAKVGLDDYLAAGHTPDDLFALTSATLREPDPIPLDQQTAETINNTDLGNARRLVKRHRDKLRYVPAWDQWLIYNGKRWFKDESGEIHRLARDTVRSIYEDAAAAKSDEDRRTLARHALSSESKSRLDSMIALAKHEPDIPVHHSELDANPWLLNVRNGTLNLRTGTLHPHRREDLITKYIDVDYLPTASCPLWLAFLDKIMAKDSAVITFLQRAVGYSLTGSTAEHILFFLYGTGRNGKSVFCGTLQHLLGDYAQKAPADMLMSKRSGSVPNDVARLPGARFVVASEIEQGRYLAEALVKDLTGGDPMSARFMHKEFFDFIPTHKLWIYGNHKPNTRGTDEGLWSRIGLIPFKVYIPKPERDTQLEQKICATELPGILAWAVQGCLEWQKYGLTFPDAVSGATAEYRAEMDVIGAFLVDTCELGHRYKEAVATLYSAYVDWCKQNGESAETQRGVSAKLKARGFTQHRSMPDGSTAWHGLRLIGNTGEEDDQEEEQAPEELQVSSTEVTEETEVSIHNFKPNMLLRAERCDEASVSSVTSVTTAHPYTYIKNTAALKARIPELLTAPVLGLDIETTGLDPLTDSIRLVQLALPNAPPLIIDAFHVALYSLDPLFSATEGPTLIGHNLVFDLAFLEQAGLYLLRPDRLFDTMIAGQLITAGGSKKVKHSLAALVERHLDQSLDKSEQTSDWAGELTPEQLQYAARDAAILLPLYERLNTAIQQAKLDTVMRLEMHTLPALVWLHLSGMPIDVAAWRRLAAEKQAEALTYQAALDALVDLPINWNSGPQVLQVLHRRGIVTESSGEEALQAYKDDPLVQALLAYRKASKMAGTYGEKWIHEHVHVKTGRVHASYKQCFTATGRLSCSAPNLQNIPHAPEYRACFKASAGKVIIKADYGQIELRIAAALSKDRTLIELFKAGEDVHLSTARALKGPDATKADRQLAKAVNFGLLYGMGAEGLQSYAQNNYGVHMSFDEAKEARERFFDTYPGISAWHRTYNGESSNEPITIRTPLGRRRIHVDKFTEKLNTPVQACGADILKIALSELAADRATVPSAKLVACVHDELVLEVDKGEAEQAGAWLKQHMVCAWEAVVSSVPIEVDVTIGQDWAGTPLEEEAISV